MRRGHLLQRGTRGLVPSCRPQILVGSRRLGTPAAPGPLFVQGPPGYARAARAEPTAEVGQRGPPRISNEATFRREVPTRGCHEKSPAHVVQQQAPPTAAVRRPPPHRAAYRPWARHEARRGAHARPTSSAVWAVAHRSRQRLVGQRGVTGGRRVRGRAPAPPLVRTRAPPTERQATLSSVNGVAVTKRDSVRVAVPGQTLNRRDFVVVLFGCTALDRECGEETGGSAAARGRHGAD